MIKTAHAIRRKSAKAVGAEKLQEPARAAAPAVTETI
jgi:hypothetical protein